MQFLTLLSFGLSATSILAAPTANPAAPAAAAAEELAKRQLICGTTCTFARRRDGSRFRPVSEKEGDEAGGGIRDIEVSVCKGEEGEREEAETEDEEEEGHNF
ncbi:hypothetical protein COCMIDRAFT_29007 [Bipolaris oryzae ATCC 44560]|uniref:Uncharacterized protein n=1 Tax=Bipolaris oryzae ATCC 44560 TaxID=930090 RepID=W6Z402_COCMI|nr:uncharacterized protein COCMIDRAFT_29007 [Bipolaris oryzae ATCC 44560]EUC42354.1 hypothetical protein COCMIDRAFT_29007 [Bipolaris oryzae ATCC 44560]